MLSSRLNAFVIPTSQTSASTSATTSLPTISTESPLASTITAAANWAASFGSGLSEKMSSASPARKRSAQPPRIPSSSVWLDRADGDRDQHARREAREDPDAAERRRRRLVPALAGRLRDESLAEVGAQERPEDESRDGQAPRA